MDIHRCSQEGERVASNEGDGLSIKSESGVVGPTIASLDCYDMHLGTLAFMPDHDSQASVVERRVWEEDGPSERREVSSAYCSRLDRVRMQVACIQGWSAAWWWYPPGCSWQCWTPALTEDHPGRLQAGQSNFHTITTHLLHTYILYMATHILNKGGCARISMPSPHANTYIQTCATDLL